MILFKVYYRAFRKHKLDTALVQVETPELIPFQMLARFGKVTVVKAVEISNAKRT